MGEGESRFVRVDCHSDIAINPQIKMCNLKKIRVINKRQTGVPETPTPKRI
jgi:hypothetical protein